MRLLWPHLVLIASCSDHPQPYSQSPHILSFGRTDTFNWPDKHFHLAGQKLTFGRMDALFPRLAAPRLLDALVESPVVLIHGPRQCGKSTLARTVCDPAGYQYLTFDDHTLRNAAASDPVGFVDDLPDYVVLDEVQRVPTLFPAIKRVVDGDRTAGRFVLTGSTNILQLPALSESLAGRTEILRLHPLAQAELERNSSTFLNRLFADGFRGMVGERLGPALAMRVASGGYPPALARSNPISRARWCQDYVVSIVERDISDLAKIRRIDIPARLLEVAASQTARLVNVVELSAPFEVSRPTIREYVTLLERMFLVDQMPSWHRNRMSRLVKAPKLHLGDTGIAAALLHVNADDLWNDKTLFGQLLETFVVQEVKRLASAYEMPVRFFHFRDKDGLEVDLVVERGPRAVAGIEVKAAATVTDADFKGLRKLQATAGASFKNGIVLYDGEMSASFGKGLYAVPMRALWE